MSMLVPYTFTPVSVRLAEVVTIVATASDALSRYEDARNAGDSGTTDSRALRAALHLAVTRTRHLLADMCGRSWAADLQDDTVRAIGQQALQAIRTLTPMDRDLSNRPLARTSARYQLLRISMDGLTAIWEATDCVLMARHPVQAEG